MSSSSRGASAARSTRAKEALVRLLWPRGEHTTAVSEAPLPAAAASSRRPPVWETSQYTYDDLKAAYLQKVKVLHPDHQPTHAAAAAHNNNKPNSSSATTHTAFVELQAAWDRYEDHVKQLQRAARESSSATMANFTLVGVGCSFADSDAEREWRTHITDQACRGWFAAGVLGGEDTAAAAAAAGPPVVNPRSSFTTTTTSVFTPMEDDENNDDDTEHVVETTRRRSSAPSASLAKKTLLPSLPPSRRNDR